MKIIKRSGSEVTFDISKIMAAVSKANMEVVHSERLSEEPIIFHLECLMLMNKRKGLGFFDLNVAFMRHSQRVKHVLGSFSV